MAKTLVANVYIDDPVSDAGIGYGPYFGNSDAVPNDVAAQIANPSAWSLTADSEAEMLALSAATVGDVVIRTDLDTSAGPPGVYILTALPPATLGNWTLLNPQPELSVDGVDIATQTELDDAVAAAIAGLSGTYAETEDGEPRTAVDTETAQTVAGVKTAADIWQFNQKVNFRKRPWASAQHPDFGAEPGGSAAVNNVALQAWLDACKAENLWGFLPPDPLHYEIDQTLQFTQKLGWRLTGGGAGDGFGLSSCLRWTGTGALQCPQRPTLTNNAGAGSLAAGTYQYRVSALNATGATMPSPENLVTVLVNASVTVAWTAITGATGYKIWRGPRGLGYNSELLLATVGVVTSYEDTGAVTPAGAYPTTYSAGGGTMLLLQGVQRGHMSDIGFRGGFGAKCGLDYDAVSGGFVSTMNTFERVGFEECAERGIRIGKSNFQTDQTDWLRISFVRNYIGASVEDANSVWHAFDYCNWQTNHIGITGVYAGNGSHFSLSHARMVSQRQWDIQQHSSRSHTFVDVQSENANRFFKGSNANAASGAPVVFMGGSVNTLTCPAEAAGGRTGIEMANSSPLVLMGFSARGDLAEDPTKNFCINATGGTRRATVSTLGCTFDGNPFRLTSNAYGMAAISHGLTTKRTSAATDAHFLGNPLPYLTPATAASVATSAATAAAAVGSRWAELAWAKIPNGTVLVAGANLFYWRSNNATGLCRVEIPTIKSFGGADAVLLGIDGSDNNASTALTVVLNVRCSAGFTLTSDLVFAIRFAPEPVTSG